MNMASIVVKNASLDASCLNSEKRKLKYLKMRMENGDATHFSTVTSWAIGSSDLRPTCHTKHQLAALCGPYHQQAVQADVVAHLSIHRLRVEVKIGGDGDS